MNNPLPLPYALTRVRIATRDAKDCRDPIEAGGLPSDLWPVVDADLRTAKRELQQARTKS